MCFAGSAGGLSFGRVGSELIGLVYKNRVTTFGSQQGHIFKVLDRWRHPCGPQLR